MRLKSNYLEYREELRRDFWYSCAYCSMTELEASAIGFEIDHFEPKTPANEAAYLNLLWSCQRCNNRKRKIWPTPANLAAGYKYLRPDVDVLLEHYDLKGDQTTLLAKTLPGEWTIQCIGLNRPYITEVRRLRVELKSAKEEVIDGIRALRDRAVFQRSQPDRFRELRRVRKVEELNESLLEDVIKEFGHSRVADPDPQNERHLSSRREFLERIGAIGVGVAKP